MLELQYIRCSCVVSTNVQMTLRTVIDVRDADNVRSVGTHDMLNAEDMREVSGRSYNTDNV